MSWNEIFLSYSQYVRWVASKEAGLPAPLKSRSAMRTCRPTRSFTRMEPITRSVQLTHIPVTAFSQTNLFLVWIYREFKPPQEPQLPITSDELHLTGHLTGHHHFTGRLKKNRYIFFSRSLCGTVDQNWHISREKKLKNRPVCKNTVK